MPKESNKQTATKMDAYLDYSYKPNSIGSGVVKYKRSEFVNAYRNHAILRNYIDLFSSEATRYFPSLFGDIGEDDANELKVIKRLRDINYIGRPLETFNWQSFWQLAFLTADLEGNCYVIIGMEGQEDTEKELQPGKLKWLALKHIDEVSPNTQTGTYSLFGGNEDLIKTRTLHKSRVIRLYGTRVPGYNRDSFIHDDSLLAPLLDEYMRLEQTFCNVAEMVAQHSFFHLAISGLTSKIVTKGASLFTQRLDKLMEGLKNMGGLLSDKDKEDATVVTRSYGGLDTIIEKNIDWFVAQTGLPKSIILSMHSQGSLSDGTKADLAILNNIIARYQSTKVAPAYSAIFDLITQELGLPEYDLKFKPTYPTDAFVQAQIDKLKAETEAITNGVGMAPAPSKLDAADDKEIAEVYKAYHSLVNMSYSQLLAWRDNPCSLKASLGRGAINRNLKILSTPRAEWTAATARSANRTISFISRMRGAEPGEHVSEDCPYSKRVISLKNWAYNPGTSK